MIQLIEAIWYLHSLGLSHWDIKLDNILIDSEWNVKITDFDFVIDIPAPCDIPADLTAINVTAGSATLLWTGVGAALS